MVLPAIGSRHSCYLLAELTLLKGDKPRGTNPVLRGGKKEGTELPFFALCFFLCLFLASLPWEKYGHLRRWRKNSLLPAASRSDVCPFQIVKPRLIRPFGFSYTFSPRRDELYEKVEASRVILQQAQGQAKNITDNCIARVGSIEGI